MDVGVAVSTRPASYFWWQLALALKQRPSQRRSIWLMSLKRHQRSWHKPSVHILVIHAYALTLMLFPACACTSNSYAIGVGVHIY